MTEALDQSEIDALLNAVNSGDVGGEAMTGQAQIFSRHRHELENVEIKPYDFKRPERISKDQIRALQLLHEEFAKRLGVSLSGFLRTMVEVRVAQADQMTFAEFVAALPNPTCFNLINCPPLEGQLCLEVSPLVVYPMIDRLLGGANQTPVIPARAMTVIERRLMRCVLERAMPALTEAWQELREIHFSLGEMESNPQIVQIVPPNEVVIALGFEVKLANRAGTMSLCIPFHVIEPLMDELSAQNWATAGRSKNDRQWERLIAGHLSDATLQIAGILAETTITVGDLRNLEVGDMLMTEKSALSPVVVTAGGRPKFLAQVGQHKGKRAMKIVRTVKPGDRV